MRSVSIFLIVVCAMCIVSCSSKDTQTSSEKTPAYVKFNGVIAGERNYELLKGPISSNREKAGIMAVLVYYGISATYTDSGQIMIPSATLNDMTLLYNVTNKANDSLWMAEHIVAREK